MLKNDREIILKRFNILIDQLTPKANLEKIELDTLLGAKSSYENFSYTDLNGPKVTSYAL